MNVLLEYLYSKMKQFPDSIITDGVEQITYKELLDYANKHYLDYVENKYGIVCKSAINTIKAIFCCLYSDSTAVVMSYRYGQKYIDKIIKKVKISFLINDNGINEISKKQEETEDISDVAYIMCTSGTTGEPKAAMITYKNILCNVSDINYYFKINLNDKFLITRPLCHASALTGELFIALSNGADIVISDSSFNPFEMSSTIHQQDITVFCCTPTVIYQLSSVFSRTKTKTRLRKIAISGEYLTQSVFQKINSVFKNVEIFNVYGLTEASPRVSYLPPEKILDNPESVGIPLPSVKLKIINDELYVSGNNVMKGYYDDIELNKKTYKDGWLKTGDAAFFDSNGLLYIKGRKDDLIIRAGMNIYPQEIENELLKIKDITDVVVYKCKNTVGFNSIGIKVVANDMSKRDIFEICKKVLPSYQLPDEIECVSILDKNESGKKIRSKQKNN